MLGTLGLCASLVVAALQPAASPAGEWRVQFATPLGQHTVIMTLNQSGAKLTGHVTDEYGEYSLEGRFENRTVTALWSVWDDGKMLEITMAGTLDGNVINGVAKLGNAGEGPLVARRIGDAGHVSGRRGLQHSWRSGDRQVRRSTVMTCRAEANQTLIARCRSDNWSGQSGRVAIAAYGFTIEA